MSQNLNVKPSFNMLPLKEYTQIIFQKNNAQKQAITC